MSSGPQHSRARNTARRQGEAGGEAGGVSLGTLALLCRDLQLGSVGEMAACTVPDLLNFVGRCGGVGWGGGWVGLFLLRLFWVLLDPCQPQVGGWG